VLRLSIVFGLAAALVELAVVWFRHMSRPILRVSDDYPWTVPAAVLVTAVIAALPFVSAMGRRPRTAGLLGLTAPGAVMFLTMLLLVPGLAAYASGVLALGLAVQGARVLAGSLKFQDVACRALWPLAALVACLALGIALQAGRSVPEAAAPPAGGGPNVILITLDTVRAASLSLYGYSRETTPNLTRHGRQGVVFDQAYSTAPWTLPSHGSLFTGRWPHELSTGYETPLDARYPTLAEHFAGLGYATAGFVANFAYCGRSSGLARGFAHYEDHPRSLAQVVANSTLLRSIADNFGLRRAIRNDEHLNRKDAATLSAAFLAWLSAQGQKPFFAFLNYFDAHEPYLPPAPFDRAFGPGRARGRHSPLHHALWNPAAARRELDPPDLREEVDAYDGAIAYLDNEIGALLDRLASAGRLDNTIVVITSDHGEEFAEHRVLEHGYSLYRPALHVPLIVLAPGRVPGGVRVRTPVSLRDVARTIGDLAGLPSRDEFPGESLAIHWTGQGDAARSGSPVLSELTRPPGRHPEWYPSSRGGMRAIVHGGFRYVVKGDGSEELYSVADDPWERHDLSGSASAAGALASNRNALGAAIGR
jgi:arylsulfatase A-like enzyme